MKADLKILSVAVLSAFGFAERVGHAGPVGPLTTFTAGTPAKASEVNGNFNAVKSAVDDNHSRITTLEGAVVNPTGNLVLVPSTPTTGNILKGTARFIHNFGSQNTFVGENAGNFTMTGIGLNTAVGADALSGNTTGYFNTASGASTLQNNTTGFYNTASGRGALQSNTTGALNTASGASALFYNTTGSANTANGAYALSFNTTGENNTAIGNNALEANTTGSWSTAIGRQALGSNTTGAQNAAIGALALYSNTTGFNNAAVGFSALYSNTTGSSNTAAGANALFNNTIGNTNVALGEGALFGNTAGERNTAMNYGALGSNTTGNHNIAIGVGALNQNTNGSFNISVGNMAGYFAKGDNNIAIGNGAGINLTTGSNNISIGNGGVTADGDTIRIGTAALQSRAFLAGIRGVTTGVVDAIPVVVDSAGQLGTLSSSRRVKDDIADMGESSGALMKLRPVTFYYKTDKNDEGRALQYGLVAEEVAAAAPELVARSADGQIETVYYQFLAPMLLNEVQKQQRTIQAQAEQIAALERDRRMQAARVEALEKQSLEIAELKRYVVRMILPHTISVKGLQ